MVALGFTISQLIAGYSQITTEFSGNANYTNVDYGNNSAGCGNWIYSAGVSNGITVWSQL